MDEEGPKIVDPLGRETPDKGEIVDSGGQVISMPTREVQELMDNDDVQVLGAAMVYCFRAYALLRTWLTEMPVGTREAKHAVMTELIGGQMDPDTKEFRPFDAEDTLQNLRQHVVPLMHGRLREHRDNLLKAERILKSHDRLMRVKEHSCGLFSKVPGPLEGEETFPRGSLILVECSDEDNTAVGMALAKRIGMEGNRSQLLTHAEGDDARTIYESMGGRGVLFLPQWMNLMNTPASPVRKSKYTDTLVIGKWELSMSEEARKNPAKKVSFFFKGFLTRKGMSLVLLGKDLVRTFGEAGGGNIPVYAGYEAKVVTMPGEDGKEETTITLNGVDIAEVPVREVPADEIPDFSSMQEKKEETEEEGA